MLRPALIALSLGLGSAVVSGQCTPQWLPGAGTPGFSGTVNATTMWDPDGVGPLTPRLVVGGSFRSVGAVAVDGIAAYNPATGVWSALGGGIDGSVGALAVLPNGDLVAGGYFTAVGPFSVTSRVVRWNGTTWSPMGSGLPATVTALAVLPNGDLVAGSGRECYRWNGTTWSTMGGFGGYHDAFFAFAVLPNGDLVAGGRFHDNVSAVNRILRWNGTSWSALGGGIDSDGQVFALAVLPNGNLVAGGFVTTADGLPANNIARWNGSAWSALGSGISSTPYHRSYVGALAVLPNGDLIAGGGFTTAGSVAASNIARWNGSAWSALGSGLSGGLFGDVNALALQPDGRLAVGGWFEIAGGNVSAYFARYATPCVATVASSGAACASSGGANSYAAVTRPWTGAAYRTRGTGLPAAGVVAVVNGFTSVSIPLAAVLPPSPAGCTLLAAPDVVDIALASAGTVDAQLALPNTPALAGVALHQQLIALEVDAQLNFVQTTSTNALVATIGTF
ncbi:MAG: hypothetical protein FJ306_06860 [Planctomycetes bacterium]|nr:hypothetical protein [Planctomycetota bacterium]